MTSKERFYAAMEYRPFDRFPTQHYGTPEVNQELMDHFGLPDYDALLLKLGDDFRHVYPPYIGPEMRQFEDGSSEWIWGERYQKWSYGSGTYDEAIYLPYKDITDAAELENIRFPSPDWFDYSGIKEQCDIYQGYAVCAGDAGIPDFINGIARCRGVEQVLVDIGLEDPVYLELMRRRFEFYYGMCERMLQAGGGRIDVLCLGEDYGSQNGLLIRPEVFDRLYAGYMKKFFDLAHRYDARAMMHVCGSCRELMPRLVELGLDILEVVQVDAARMDITELHGEFYGKLAFCGSVSVQQTLPYGAVEDVVREVELRKRLFAGGGMIIAPTHAIQVGTPIENIVAMYRAIGSLEE